LFSSGICTIMVGYSDRSCVIKGNNLFCITALPI
jgi:hypothetical protein